MSDQTKPRVGLVPLNGMLRAARVMEAGLRDGRGPGDWKKMKREDFVDARMRHIIQADMGDDSEDHEAAIMANTHIIAWFDEQKSSTPTPAADAGGIDPFTVGTGSDDE